MTDLSQSPGAKAVRFARSKAGPLIILLIGAGGLVTFLLLARETVIEGETRAFDLSILNALRRPGQPHVPIGPRGLLEAARDLSALGSIAVLNLIALLIIGLTLVRRRFGAALLIVAALGGGMIFCQLLKHSFERARPPEIYREIAVINTSFPSGHAMLSAVTYLTLAALLARVMKSRAETAYLVSAAVLLTAIVGVTRIFLGVHWTTDVLAGWSVGAFWAVVCWLASFAWEGFVNRRIAEPGALRPGLARQATGSEAPDPRPGR